MSIRDDIMNSRPVSCKVIDAHTHIGRYDNMGWHQRWGCTDMRSVVAYNDRLGIDCMVTIPHCITDYRMEEANSISERTVKEFPGKVYAYIAVVPTCGMDAVKRELNKYSKVEGFLGLKFLPGFYHGALTAPEYQYAMDFAAEAGCPILCHVWGNEPKHSDIDEAAERRPNMKFIIAHQGGGYPQYTDSAAEIVRRHEHVYMELCGSMDNRYSIGKIVSLVGEDKVIFGTDGINLDPKYELGKVGLSSIDDRIKRKIFAENYLRILKGSHLGSIR